MFLGKVVLAVGFEELVVGAHEAAHHVDQVAEDLHAAHAQEVLRRGVARFHGVGEGSAEAGDVGVHVSFVCGHACQEVAAHLGAGLQQQAEVLFLGISPFDQIAERCPHRDGTVPVAELAVVVHLEAGAHRMVLDTEGIEDGVVLMDRIPEEVVESVFIDAFASRGAVEAAQAAALERKFLDIDDIASEGGYGNEAVDHLFQAGVTGLQVGHYDGFLVRVPGGGDAAVNLPEDKAEPVLRLLPAGFLEDVVHVGGQSVQYPQAHVPAVVLDEAVGRDVVKVLGSGYLRGRLS